MYALIIIHYLAIISPKCTGKDMGLSIWDQYNILYEGCSESSETGVIYL